MTDIRGILVASQIIPSTDGTILEHATHLSQFGKGGWHEVSTIQERDAITNDRCEVGMSVYVTSEKKLYILSALDTSTDPYTKTWTLFSAGGVVDMPTPSATELNNIVQYIGETTQDYTQGYFYKCISDGQDPATYSWVRIDVQPAVHPVETANIVYGTNENGEQTEYNLTTFGQIDNVAIHGVDQTVTEKRVDLSVVEQVERVPTASEDLEGRVLQYTGLTTEIYTNGYFYECVSDGEDPASYSWERVNVQPETEIVDNVTTQSSTSALSANMGYELNQRINNVEGRGRYLSNWVCGTGLPTTDPVTLPYVLKPGDYYIVSSVEVPGPERVEIEVSQGTDISDPTIDAETFIEYVQPTEDNEYLYWYETSMHSWVRRTEDSHIVPINLSDYGITVVVEGSEPANNDVLRITYTSEKKNYRPTYEEIVIEGETKKCYNGHASDVIETLEVAVNDTYVFDGNNWILLSNSQKEITFGIIAGSPYDNVNLGAELNTRLRQVDELPNYGADDSKVGDVVQYMGQSYDYPEYMKHGYIFAYTKTQAGPHSASYGWVPLYQQQIEEKLDKVTDQTSVVYGIDENGNQTTYDVNDFGQIDNVAVHGVDQTITDKRVDLSVVEQYDETTIPEASADLLGRVIQYIGQDTNTLTHDYFYECVEVTNTNFTIWTDNEGDLSHFYEPQYYNKETFENYVHPTESTTITLCCKIISEDPWEVMWYLEDDPNPENPTEARPSWYGWEYTPDDLDRTTGANDTDQIKFIYITNTTYEWVRKDVQPNTAIWGSITGTLSEQTDLQNALNAKQNTLTAGTNITIEEDVQTGNLVISSVAQESFFRGRFENWSNVPTDPTYYEQDLHNPPSKIPETNDYIVVNDMSDWRPSDFDDSFELWNNSKNYQTIWSWKYDNVITTKSIVYNPDSSLKPEDQWFEYFGPHNEVLVRRTSQTVSVIAQTILRYNNTIYAVGQTLFSESLNGDGCDTTHPHVIEFSNSTERKEGTWRMRYQGVWDTDGKNGWKPEYQIENVLPIATDTEPGITKLYTTTGQNEDGSVTQKLVTDELGTKQDTLTPGTGIDISTDAQTGDLVISSTSYESLFKGKYNTWNDVPTVGANYPLYIDDGVHTHEPTYTDYMVVVDASTVPGGQVPIVITFKINAYGQQGSVKTNIDGTEYNGYGLFDGKVQVRTDVSSGNYGTQFVVLSEDIEYQGHTYHQGEVFLEILHNQVVYGQEYTYNAQLSLGYPYEGTWRFSYRGVWATDNRNGWKGEYPIEQELPIASDTVAGITKLYTDLGENTDGAVDQATVTTELGKKQDTLTEGSGISIDENNVISATFSESYFRGKFSTWDTVPTDYRSYYPDYTGSTKPTRTDYMVVEDPSSYVKPGDPIQIYNEPKPTSIAYARIVFGATDITLAHDQVGANPDGVVIGTVGNQLRVKYVTPTWSITPLDIPVIVDGVEKPINEVAFSWGYGTGQTEVLVKELNFVGTGGYEGTWRFSYQSDNWDTSGKNGWEPEYQIEDILPIATDTDAGIMKLYTTTGSNTDGTMDQSSITTELGNKQDVLTNASNAGEGIIIDDVTQEISTNNIVWRKW